jgi:hypothetical protein
MPARLKEQMMRQGPPPKTRTKHYSYDESVDEAAKLIDVEPVDVEGEQPAEENEPVESVDPEDNPPPPAFEE